MFCKLFFALTGILSVITISSVCGVDVMFTVDCRLNVNEANGSIYISAIDETSTTLNFQALPLENMRNPVAVDFDPNEGKIYWTDYTAQSISRAFLNGSHRQVLVSGLGHPTGLAINVFSHTMYWADEDRQNIGKANLDGTNPTIILDNLDYRPRPIVINFNSEHIYWAEYNHISETGSKIKMASADGTNVTSLIQSDLVYPNGLSLDLQGGYIYWCDAGSDKIERSTLTGMNREVIFHTANYNMKPFDLIFYKDFLYWTDWSTRLITRVHIDSKPGIFIGGPVGGGFDMSTGIHLQKDFTWSCFSEPCLNGGTCLDNAAGFSCVCPPGFSGQTCQTEVTTTATSTKLTAAKVPTENDHEQTEKYTSDSPIFEVTTMTTSTNLTAAKVPNEYDYEQTEKNTSVTYPHSMSSVTVIYEYNTKGQNYRLVHSITTTAVWTLLSFLILMILGVTYYKISCHQKMQVLYETAVQKFTGKSMEVYDTVSEFKPREDYATSIDIKIKGFDNPGYINANGMAGFQPRYVNLLPTVSDDSTEQSDEILPQPPSPPPTEKLNELKQSQQKN